eukprot:m.171176 g.171176  ORF g.171176 m.171176 type:complete len:58 (+) comp15347_c0_seq4:141-314(+)
MLMSGPAKTVDSSSRHFEDDIIAVLVDMFSAAIARDTKWLCLPLDILQKRESVTIAM